MLIRVFKINLVDFALRPFVSISASSISTLLFTYRCLLTNSILFHFISEFLFRSKGEGTVKHYKTVKYCFVYCSQSSSLFLIVPEPYAIKKIFFQNTNVSPVIYSLEVQLLKSIKRVYIIGEALL